MRVSSILLGAASVSGETYFKESFGEGWDDRWVKSEWKDAAEIGEWVTTEGKFYGKKGDMALKTSEDARFYGLSAKMDKTFNNEGKDLIIQYSVKNEQDIDCGGAYIKLLPDVDQKKFGGDSEYGIMFGPDICGYTKRTHVIFTYDKKEGKPTNYLHNTDVKTESDKFTHLYTLHLKSDNTYDVLIDGESVQSGKIEDNFDVFHPKEIKDPEQSKPEDWVDEIMIPDPEDKKPEGYDDIPSQIPDPDAKKPEDWDDEDDGEWEPPQIDNPEYKGEWVQKQMENPDYKGEWEHPLIANPEYSADEKLYNFCKECTHVGFELWQVKSGTLFDDIIVTDSMEEAKKFADETFYAKRDAEKEMAEKQEKVEEEARKEAEKAKEEEDEDADDDEDEEEEETKEL